MQKISIWLKKQRREIKELKKCPICAYNWRQEQTLLVFGEVIVADGNRALAKTIQQRIDEGFYKSITDFDSYHTADVEYSGTYTGRELGRYRHQTMLNLKGLGEAWRKRISEEYPGVDIRIVLHRQNEEWFLDTFNYAIKIEGAIYL